MSTPVKYHVGEFPPDQLKWDELIPFLGPAAAAIARYDGLLAAIPEPSVLLAPLSTQEAVLSSRIEGTQATFGEVLGFEAGDVVPDERRGDIYEILNYRRAVQLAEKMLQELPICLRVLRAVHEKLLDGVRGDGLARGEFRRAQNWIGPAGSSLDDAKFIPISPAELDDGLNKWEGYVNGQQPDTLVQLAIMHAEFEALHPFLDGNGRLGRMLIPLFLWQHKLIRAPMFYMSAYLEANRETYYERLRDVSRTGAWTAWCAFFLKGVQVQAEENLGKAQTILKLYNNLKPKVVEATRSQYAIHALDWIFCRPVFSTSDFVAKVTIPEATARRILTVLKEEGILVVVRQGSGRKPDILAFRALLNCAEGRELL